MITNQNTTIDLLYEEQIEELRSQNQHLEDKMNLMFKYMNSLDQLLDIRNKEIMELKAKLASPQSFLGKRPPEISKTENSYDNVSGKITKITKIFNDMHPKQDTCSRTRSNF